MAETSTDDTLIAVAERARSAGRATAPASGATRYLAAAAYTDKRFRDAAIELDRAEFRAAAPELGIDAALVLAHCRTARRREALRDAALCAALIVLAATGFFGDLVDYPDEFLEVLVYHSGALIGCWAFAAVIVFVEIFLREHLTLTRHFAVGSSAAAAERAAPSRTNSQNVVVYGGFSPFVGSGADLGGWSFTVNLEQGRLDLHDGTPKPFEIGELYDALRNGFERLAIDGLRVSDRLFVDGRSIRDDRRFLPRLLSRPATQVDPKIVDFFQAHPEKTVRHYLCLEITDWSGELVLSTFIRLQKSHSKLFVEASSFLLPPLKRQYYDLDKHAPTRMVGKIIHWLTQSAILGPVLVPVAVFTTWGRLWYQVRLIFEAWGNSKEIRHNPLHNYGALRSIRELGMENSWRVYFQKLDKEMHSKVIQQQMLDVLITFLGDHGVDPSEIKDRGTHILNNGVIVSGGMISAEGLAVGQGAQASVAKRGRRSARGQES